MHQGFVGFPTIGTRVIAGPSYKELHAGFSMMITTMCHDISDHEFLLILLSNLYWVDVIGVKYKRMCVLIFNDKYRLFTSDTIKE